MARERFAQAGNVVVPAVLALRELGFVVTRHQDGAEEHWQATSTDLVLTAADPLQLLGLVKLRTTRGSEWNASDTDIKDFFRDYYDESAAG